jgi:hypothetical protein
MTEHKPGLDQVIPPFLLEFHRAQSAVEYGSASAKVIKAGGVTTETILSTTKSVRFRGSGNEQAWAFLADLVRSMSTDTRAIDIAATCEDGLVRKVKYTISKIARPVEIKTAATK